MPTRSLSTLVLLAAVFAAGTRLEAQCHHVPDFDAGNFVCTPPGEGDYGAIAAGDLNDNFSMEVALIRGGDLVLFHGPDSESAAVDLADGAIDVCFARSGSSSGGPAFLFLADGLQRVEYDAEDGYVVQLISEHPKWLTATQIRWANTGAGPGLEEGVIAFSPEDDSFFRSVPDGSGGFTTPTHLFECTLAVQDFVLLNWSGNVDREIAFLHGTGIRVYDQSGGLLLNRLGVQAGDGIARVVRLGWHDSLAWSTRNATSSLLLLFNSAWVNPIYQLEVLSVPGIYDAIVGADLDGDEDGDLVLASSSSTTLQLYHQSDDPNGNWFDGDEVSQIELGVAEPAEPRGKLLVANVFNDFDGEEQPIPGFGRVLVDVAEGEFEGLRVIPNLGTARSSVSPDFDDFVVYETGLHRTTPWSCTGSPTDAPPSQWTIHIGQGWGDLPEATHYDVIVRRSDEPGEAPVAHWSALNEPLNGVLWKNLSITFDAHASDDDLGEDNDVCYFVKVRPRKLNFAWRWSVLSFSAGCGGFEALVNQQGAFHRMGPFNWDLLELDRPVCNYEPEDCAAGTESGNYRYIPSPVPQSFIPNSGGTLPPPPN